MEGEVFCCNFDIRWWNFDMWGRGGEVGCKIGVYLRELHTRIICFCLFDLTSEVEAVVFALLDLILKCISYF